MDRPVRVLCVCTHNRTRSVMMTRLLEHHCDSLGVEVDVRSGGFVADGEPATPETVRMLADLGLDASPHRSRVLRAADASDADLVVTAEHRHVIEIVGADPSLFARTFTLPEAVARGEEAGRRGDLTPSDWLAQVNRTRPNAIAYLDAVDEGSVGEIDDPTGRSKRHWTNSFEEIDDLTRRLAALL